MVVVVPPEACQPSGCQWTILVQSETAFHSRKNAGRKPDAGTPLTRLALLTARYGFGALFHVPSLHLGKLFTVDRSEIESLPRAISYKYSALCGNWRDESL
jgi:hypothetical protein